MKRRAQILDHLPSINPWLNDKYKQLQELKSINTTHLEPHKKYEVLIERIRHGDFKAYVLYVSNGDFMFDTVHNVIAEFFGDLIFRRVINSALSLGPRHGKSRLMSYLCSFMFGLTKGETDQLYITYGQNLTEVFGRSIRDTMMDPRHLDAFPESKLSTSSKGAKQFQCKRGGRFFGSSIGGTLTGMGAGHHDLNNFPGGLFIDDPVKSMAEALSEPVMEALHSFYSSEIKSRPNKNHFKLLTATRYSLNDLHAHVMGPDLDKTWSKESPLNYRYLNIPTLSEDLLTDPLCRKEIDIPAWPFLFTSEELVHMREENPYEFSALYQGNPVPRQGSLVRENVLEVRNDVPLSLIDHKFVSIDPAFGVGKDETSITLFGLSNLSEFTVLYVLDQFSNSSWGLTEISQILVRLQKNFKLDVPIVIEETSQSKYLIDHLKKIIGFPIIPIKVTKSKEQRLIEVLPYLNNVVFKNADYYPELKYQLLGFPFLPHDDRVDSLVLGINYWGRNLRPNMSLAKYGNKISSKKIKEPKIPRLSKSEDVLSPKNYFMDELTNFRDLIK